MEMIRLGRLLASIDRLGCLQEYGEGLRAPGCRAAGRDLVFIAATLALCPPRIRNGRPHDALVR